ncbi:MAG: hypothetical protein WCT27_04800 [Patescibacteria group bacterium]|jgi:hypothetical protein
MAVVMALILGSALFTGCTEDPPKPILAQDSVSSIMAIQAKLERALTLCIIDGAPAHPGPRNMFSIEEAKQSKARLEKELEFLQGFTSINTSEDLKAKGKAFSQYPSQKTSDEFRDVLSLYLRQVRKDIERPLFQEMVNPDLTSITADLLQQLDQAAARL